MSLPAGSLTAQSPWQSQRWERDRINDLPDKAIERLLQPIGHRLYSLSREVVQQVVDFTQTLLTQGKSVDQFMEMLMPA